MTANPFVRQGCDVAWCPGCGNYDILKLMSETLAALELDPQQVVLVSGIGQAAKNSAGYCSGRRLCRSN